MKRARGERAPAVPVLFVVHPGSACGSADWNLGDEAAAAARAALAADLEAWTGGVVVIDGDLSGELLAPPYRRLGRAVEGALARAASAGMPVLRVAGDAWDAERDQRWAASRAARLLRLAPEGPPPEVTGAWLHLGDEEGCVNSVRDALAQAGLAARVRASAVAFDAPCSESLPESRDADSGGRIP